MSFEDRDLRDPEPVIPQSEIETLKRKLHVAQELHKMFRSAGWRHVVAMMTNEAREAHSGLEGTAHDMEQIARYREQLRLSRWLLSLEETVNKAREQDAELLEELHEQTEGDPDV